jgi:hypothetical protein
MSDKSDPDRSAAASGCGPIPSGTGARLRLERAPRPAATPNTCAIRTAPGASIIWLGLMHQHGAALPRRAAEVKSPAEGADHLAQ